MSNGLTWVSDMSELEKFTTPQLISYLKTEFRAGVYNKVEQILTSREVLWKQKEEMWKQKNMNLETRVVKLEEETSALVVLAQELSENPQVDLDVGEGNLLSGQTNEMNGGGVCDFTGLIQGPPVVNSSCKPLADDSEEREIVIEISDSEDDDKCINGSDIEAIDQLKEKDDINLEIMTHLRACSSQGGGNYNSSKEKNLPPSPKRRRLLKLGCSDSEDDNIPANGLSCSNSKKCTPSSTPKTRKRILILANSDSEGDDCCTNDPDGSSKNTINPQKAEGLTNVLSSIRKWKSTSLKWQFEIDMVTSFETDPILCMKAVCALYRHHNFQDKAMRGSSSTNYSGVCRYGERGTALAKFLLDGNEGGEMKKSVKDLEAYDSKGVVECQRVAKYYSDRLFTMYQNKEDPFFP